MKPNRIQRGGTSASLGRAYKAGSARNILAELREKEAKEKAAKLVEANKERRE